MTARSRTVAVLLAVLVGAGACGTSHPSAAKTPKKAASSTTSSAPTSTEPSAATTTTTTIPACQSSQLQLSSGGSVGAGGTSYSTYYLTNTGSKACAMEGYPGVAVLDAQGTVVQHPATRGALGTHAPIPVTEVVLEPGQRAEFLVTSDDNVPNADCPSEYSGTTLQVYPPNQTTPLDMAFTGGFCDLGVGPLQAS